MLSLWDQSGWRCVPDAYQNCVVEEGAKPCEALRDCFWAHSLNVQKMEPLANLSVSDLWDAKPKCKLEEIGNYESVCAYRMRRAAARFQVLQKIIKQFGVFFLVI